MGIMLIVSDALQQGSENSASNELPELQSPAFQRASASLPELREGRE